MSKTVTLYGGDVLLKFEEGSHRTIPVSKELAKVDLEDFDRLSGFKWYLVANGYAMAAPCKNGKREYFYMHHMLVPKTKGKEVDHINGDKLDNRKMNLRLVSCQGNQANEKLSKNNTSGFKGVHWDKTKRKWGARIKVNYTGIFLGRYDNKIDAAKAYNQAALKHFGEYARLNDV